MQVRRSVTIHGFWRFFGYGNVTGSAFDGSEKQLDPQR